MRFLRHALTVEWIILQCINTEKIKKNSRNLLGNLINMANQSGLLSGRAMEAVAAQTGQQQQLTILSF